jgi:hypothetical protein
LKPIFLILSINPAAAGNSFAFPGCHLPAKILEIQEFD